MDKWNFYLETKFEEVDMHGLTLEEARAYYVDAVNRYCDSPWFKEFGDSGEWIQEYFEGIDAEENYFKGGFCPEF